MKTETPSLRRLAALLAIPAAALAAYFPVLGAGFVFDDHPLLLESALIRGPLSRYWFSTEPLDYWPISMTSLWLEWRAFGVAPLGYHVVSLVLHAAAAVLVWRVLRTLRVPGAWLAAVVFAVHPVTVESVAWISERKNTLSAVLALGSFLTWLRFDAERRSRDRTVALALFVLALLAKTSAVMLPVVMLGVALYRRNRVGRSDVVSTAPFFAASLAGGLVTLWFQSQKAIRGGWIPPRGAAERVGGAGWALVEYARDALFPVGVPFVHPGWPIDVSSALFFLPLALVAVSFAVLWRYRDGWARAPLFGFGFQAVMLLPVLGFADMAYFHVAPVSNHLQYLAVVGPVAVVSAAVAKLAESRRAIALGGAATAVALLAVLTSSKAEAFQDDLSLWRRAVRDAPESAFAHEQLAVQLMAPETLDQAVREMEAAAEVTRDPAVRHHARSYALLLQNRHEEAIGEAREAARLRPSPDYLQHLGMQLSMGGSHVEAIQTLLPLLAGDAHEPNANYWLARSLAAVGRVQESREHLAVALGVSPLDPQIDARLVEWLGSSAAVAR